MDFRTIVTLPDMPFQISYQDRLFSFGSCFSEHIGNKLAQAFFQITPSPFGILYNPASIARSLSILQSDKLFGQSDLFFHNDLWHSPLHHGDFSASSTDGCLERINSRLIAARTAFSSTGIMLITFGTAWVYEQDGEIVSNCHKLPANHFTRRRLTIDEIVKLFENIPVKTIFTVSPIRHWKDGAHENQLSKSILLLAIEEICRRNPNCAYFPSYEIVLDELRDYRFYTEDMLHPNATAINYIWQRFGEAFFSQETRLAQTELEQLRRDLSHKPLHPDTAACRNFQVQTMRKAEELQQKYPWLTITEQFTSMG